MSRWAVLLFVFALLGSAALQAEDQQIEATIQSMIQETATIWNQRAGHGFGKHFAENAHFVNILGLAYHGKETIEKHHIKVLSGFLKGTKLQFDNIQVYQVVPDVTIALSHWKLLFPPKSPLAKNPKLGITSYTLVKNKDKWAVVLCQSTPSHL